MTPRRNRQSIRRTPRRNHACPKGGERDTFPDRVCRNRPDCLPDDHTARFDALAPPAPAGPPAKLVVAPDTPQRLAQLPRTVIDYDHALLNDNDRQVVAKLIEASKLIDEIYWRQVSEDNPDLRTRLYAQAKSGSPLAAAGYDYFLLNKGRWDRLKQDEPFVAPFGPAGAKPPGAAFYPANMTQG